MADESRQLAEDVQNEALGINSKVQPIFPRLVALEAAQGKILAVEKALPVSQTAMGELQKRVEGLQVPPLPCLPPPTGAAIDRPLGGAGIPAALVTPPQVQGHEADRSQSVLAPSGVSAGTGPAVGNVFPQAMGGQPPHPPPEPKAPECDRELLEKFAALCRNQGPVELTSPHPARSLGQSLGGGGSAYAVSTATARQIPLRLEGTDPRASSPWCGPPGCGAFAPGHEAAPVDDPRRACASASGMSAAQINVLGGGECRPMCLHTQATR